MNTRKGIVFETTSSYSIFFTPDGVFEKGIPLDSSVQLGEETYYRPYLKNRVKKVSFNPSWTAPIVSVVATLVLLFSVLLPAQSTVSAYVQIDINPSVELGIDDEGTVYSFKGLNEDGNAVKRDINFWKGKPLSWVILQIVDHTESVIVENEKIEITTIYENDENHDKLEKVIVSAVTNSTNKIKLQPHSINVTEASVEERKAASSKGKSVQKYKAELDVGKEEKQKKSKKDFKQSKQENKKLKKPTTNSKGKTSPKNKESKPQKQREENTKEKSKSKKDKEVKTEVKHQSHKKQQKEIKRDKQKKDHAKPSKQSSNKNKKMNQHKHENIDHKRHSDVKVVDKGNRDKKDKKQSKKNNKKVKPTKSKESYKKNK